MFGLPVELTHEIMSCKRPEDVLKVGIEWTTAQCKELIARGVPCLHFYTMSRHNPTISVLRSIF